MYVCMLRVYVMYVCYVRRRVRLCVYAAYVCMHVVLGGVMYVCYVVYACWGYVCSLGYGCIVFYACMS